MPDQANLVRLSLPSKGRLGDDSMIFFQNCGLPVYRPNPRQYEARIPNLPNVLVLFQRPSDIVISVRNGSVDFGVSGMDVIEEHRGDKQEILVLHDALNYGECKLALAVPENWEGVQDIAGLRRKVASLPTPLRVATKYPVQTTRFCEKHGIVCELVSAEGALETAPSIGYADMISDLVASGQTLRDNRLRLLSDGLILESQAALIANRASLQNKPEALQAAQHLLEYIEAHLRAEENLSVVANIRGNTPEEIAQKLFTQTTYAGLQGPTISRVINRQGDPGWHAIHIIVRKDQLFQAVTALRAIGGSGVVVSPVTYIFEEEPPRYNAMLRSLKATQEAANA